jgi:hypothetical protein
MKAQEAREPRVSPEGYRRNLDAMVELARARGARVLLLSLWGEYESGPYRRTLYDVAEERGVPIVQYQGEKLDIVHPTVEGYEEFATKILLRLAYEEYLG